MSQTVLLGRLGLLATVVRAAVGAAHFGVLLVVPLPLAGLAAEPLAPPAGEVAAADDTRPRRERQPSLNGDDLLGVHSNAHVKYSEITLNYNRRCLGSLELESGYHAVWAPGRWTNPGREYRLGLCVLLNGGRVAGSP